MMDEAASRDPMVEVPPAKVIRVLETAEDIQVCHFSGN
jgi:hypothetical protein